MIGALLNQDIFAVLLLVAALASLRRPDYRTVALLFFGAGYFSTQIPLRFGMGITLEDKLFLQGLVSMCLLFLYSSVPTTRYILVAMVCELGLVLVNITSSITTIHPWWHWAAFAVFNYISFISLCLNKWGQHHDGAAIDHHRTADVTFDHIYNRARAHLGKGKRLAGKKD